MGKDMTYEAALGRLSNIINELERGELDLNKSIEMYEEGIKLSSYCYDALEKAEQKVTELDKLIAAKKNVKNGDGDE